MFICCGHVSIASRQAAARAKSWEKRVVRRVTNRVREESSCIRIGYMR
jgi:hypothetical protein